ncbi:MAG: hypothetical protein U0232_05270 [Thermomicrobiales bacterium]
MESLLQNGPLPLIVVGFFALTIWNAICERKFKALYRARHSDSPPATIVEEIEAWSRGRVTLGAWNSIYRTPQPEPELERARRQRQLASLLYSAWIFGWLAVSILLDR